MGDAEEIVRTHGPLVWRVLHRLLGGSAREADVADGFQEVFVQAIEVGRRETVRNWEGLLRRIATTRGLDLLRARIRGRAREGEAEWSEVAGKGELPEERMRRGERAEALRRALAAIEPREAEIFCLRHVEGMSYEEIGGQMEMTANAVGVVLHRAKGKLRRQLDQEMMTKRGEVPYE